MIIGKTLSAIPQGSVGQVAIYEDAADTGERIDAHSHLGEVPAGTFVGVTEFPCGYEITCREC